MKSLLKIAFLLALTVQDTQTASAQLLKNVINTIKQTTQNHADNKAREATDNTLDHAEKKVLHGKNATGKPLNDSVTIDTAAVGAVLGAFAKAANDNPGDTSAGDLVGKALNNLIGGGGVSHDDSAKALQSFQTAHGGAGFEYRYITQLNSKRMGNTRDTSIGYLTNLGEMRSEAAIPIPGHKGGKLVTIAHAGNSRFSLILDADDKTYSLNVIDTALINGGPTHYTAVKAGTETVNGYVCTKAKLISSTGSGMFKSSTTMDVWMSSDVPGAALMKKIMSTGNVSPQMLSALHQAGCDGVIVRVSSEQKDFSMTMELEKATRKTFPAADFRIPDGYTNADRSIISALF